MSNLAYLNPGGVSVKKQTALAINLAAARGLHDVLKSNLGPRGTLKMLVGGAGQIKITKDGNVLLGEMQIQHPTATMIARAATATDDTTGDGTTSSVLIIGEMLRQCERYLAEGMHPRIITEGMDIAKREALKHLDKLVVPLPTDPAKQKEWLHHVALTSVATKVGKQFGQQLATSIVDAIECIRHAAPNEPIDLHMVEIMHMKHRMSTDTAFIKGLVMDHGARHDGMPKRIEDTYILTLNVSLEYERSELGANFFYNDPSKKDAMATAERKITDDRVRKIIELKRSVKKNLVVVNQKGIDPIALEMLAKEGIYALRRAKRRNMERLTLACGGEALNSVENITPECLGYAGLVYEHTLGDEKYTFIEDVKVGNSCTLLVKGPNDHTIAQIKDALRDGLRSLKNAIDDKALLPGAGAVEVALHRHLTEFSESVQGKPKIGVKAFADSLLVIPKILAENGGHDAQASLIELQAAWANARKSEGKFVGIDVDSGNVLDPVEMGIWDNVIVKRTLLESTAVIVSELLLVDEIVKAGRRGAGGAPQQ
eukprot:PhM_4_TR14800/c0_g1_i1/m.89266/K09498/CCT6; T-complex protein 1 subunit zeta